MKIEQWEIAKLTPYDRNPRRNDEAVDAVAASIREYGFRQPIVVDAEGVVIAGHTRLKAAQKLELAKVPVHVAKDLTPDQAKALRIADNKSGELAVWDNELLALELGDLKQAGYDLADLGFDKSELQGLLFDKASEPDEIVEPPEKPVSQPGDLWTLGDHRLLCGDSTNAGDVDRLMDGERAAMVATDPPYLVDYTGERAENPNGQKVDKDWSANYREIDIDDPERFFRGLFENIIRIIAPHAAIYCWHAHSLHSKIESIWLQLGILPHQVIIWSKHAPLWGRMAWLMQHEPCIVGWVKGSKPSMFEMKTGENGSVWHLGWEDGKGGEKSRVTGNEHPTQKPVEIFARPMRKHTKPGQVCYEPFSGSGSQLIAGETEGRRVFAMEISPAFVDVGVRRWEKYTGKKATRVNAKGRKAKGLPAEQSSE